MKGSYTVEASWIMAIVLSVLCATILLSYEVFQEVTEDVTATVKKIDSVSLFYKSVGLRDLLEKIK